MVEVVWAVSSALRQWDAVGLHAPTADPVCTCSSLAWRSNLIAACLVRMCMWICGKGVKEQGRGDTTGVQHLSEAPAYTFFF